MSRKHTSTMAIPSHFHGAWEAGRELICVEQELLIITASSI